MTDTSTTPARATESAPGGFFGRIILFIRQVIDEVRKVVRPTREELWNYTAVVVVFVVLVMLFVVGLDQLFQRVVEWVFGSGS
ncbi:preprotein translocase subunit SecE [Calidifontibacter sp. DB0510]|uniref:Protein translocase subunit SecE n=1 Tax=Metallococcus carri TaxID=1656884 RepID=A0A967AZG6_9MICO|nr:preprotein translocase subunit SecE [Metallococcus carri]NHN55209.1 preprotein translocase subunit SecE [Metallococcus carri]NOP36286.1 preprotein translocase subunit SecE [Calidifontibacter sp. DB2511S]